MVNNLRCLMLYHGWIHLKTQKKFCKTKNIWMSSCQRQDSVSRESLNGWKSLDVTSPKNTFDTGKYNCRHALLPGPGSLLCLWKGLPSCVCGKKDLLMLLANSTTLGHQDLMRVFSTNMFSSYWLIVSMPIISEKCTSCLWMQLQNLQMRGANVK